MAKLRDMIDGRLLAGFPAPKGKKKPVNDDEQDEQNPQQQFGKPPMPGQPPIGMKPPMPGQPPLPTGQPPMGQHPPMGPSQPQMQQSPVPGSPSSVPGGANHFPSPAGQHVANHVQDPYTSTKQELDELNQAKLAYEMKKAQMQMKLAPVQHVVDGIKQMHEMNDPNQSPDAQMGYTDPNDPTGQGAGMGANPGAGVPQSQPMMPPNMPLGVPGMPQAPKEAIRPLKLGQPAPGMGNPAAMAGNPSAQFNPGAPKPPGAGSLPGAKGPGDPKVQNKIGQAQSGGKKPSGSKSGGSSSSGKVAIHVHADSISRSPAKSTMSNYAGADSLRGCHHADDEECSACKMKAYGTREGVRKAWESRSRGKHEPIVDINDKRGFNAPIDRQKVSPKTHQEWFPGPAGYANDINRKPKETNQEWFPGPAGYAKDFNLKSMKGGVFKANVKAVAPPGREKQVKRLKKKFGETSAFKLAWNSYNKSKRKH